MTIIVSSYVLIWSGGEENIEIPGRWLEFKNSLHDQCPWLEHSWANQSCYTSNACFLCMLIAHVSLHTDGTDLQLLYCLWTMCVKSMWRWLGISQASTEALSRGRRRDGVGSWLATVLLSFILPFDGSQRHHVLELQFLFCLGLSRAVTHHEGLVRAMWKKYDQYL